MQLININDSTYNVYLPDYAADDVNIADKSSLHQAAYKLLKAFYPLVVICQEIPACCGPDTLYLDLFIPNKMLAVECQGEQHYKFNKFFHANKLDYYKGVQRDKMKRSFCELNNILLVEFPFNEGIAQWRQRLMD